MPITIATINAVKSEIMRFSKILNAASRRMEVENARSKQSYQHQPLITGSKETAALRRASMDLSNVLVNLRRPWKGSGEKKGEV